jgi:hypothetical protein
LVRSRKKVEEGGRRWRREGERTGAGKGIGVERRRRKVEKGEAQNKIITKQDWWIGISYLAEIGGKKNVS